MPKTTMLYDTLIPHVGHTLRAERFNGEDNPEDEGVVLLCDTCENDVVLDSDLVDLIGLEGEPPPRGQGA